MKFLRLFAFTASLLALALPAQAAKQKPTRPSTATRTDAGTYKGYIVIDAASGNMLSEQSADVVTPPASMTKLMTFAVLYDRLQSGALTLETPVQVDAADAKMGGTQVYLDPREVFPVEELIYAMMIQSANDAAHALARTTAGSVPAFVELMNAKARELGMTHTTFRTPHGLPPPSRRLAEGDLSTPRDFALLCRHLLLKTDILKYTSVKRRDFGSSRAKGPLHMDNHNKLLGKVAGVDGLKTGYTEGAGYCLSATAERNGRRVIVVIMGAFGPNGQIDRGRARDLKTIELIEAGFAALPLNANPIAPAASTRPTASLTVAKPLPTAKPVAAPSAAPATAPEAASPVRPAASGPVAPAAGDTEGAPTVKFELPGGKS